MKRPIIDPNKSYTFRDYFAMNVSLADLLAYFGYTHQSDLCTLPQTTADLTYFAALKGQLEAYLRITDLNAESTRREVLVAPILLNLGVYLQTKVQMEYPLRVTNQLKGKIDYYLRRNGNLLIVEAKHDDMMHGFAQLSVELIAFDQWLDEDSKPLYGVVTIGDTWRFGILDRLTKQITQDINLYRVPADLTELLQILIAILE